MKYSEKILEHFFRPRNVGNFTVDEESIGRTVVGNYENGSLIHFQIKIYEEKIVAARFKAYGSCPLIAACSYATEWVIQKTIADAKLFTSAELITALEIPPLKIYCALLVEDALMKSIEDYSSAFV